MNIWTEPGTNAKSGWLYPKFLRILYVFNLVVICLFALVNLGLGFASLVAAPALGLLLIILAPVLFLLQLLFTRFWYEAMLLVFRMFESSRETVGLLVGLNESVKQAAETQTRGLQYICDRLAQICDNMEEKR